METLFISLLIDVHEFSDMATFDVLGIYLQVDLAAKENGERVVLRLTGDFIHIMCDVNPEHKKHIMYEEGRKGLYMEVLKTIYRCI